ncbi:MAG TPA: site-specific DNA-methyltransferase [Solirubrobacterales bacterium]|nr:site-specific DNA-methyltransferase [Solirubrobacterales bacterium]
MKTSGASNNGRLGAASPREGVLAFDSARNALARWAESFEGQVELALLDPPYNTRSNFHHYRDQEHPERWLEERREEAEALLPLLSSSGSLWMHLDDAEMHYAKVMLDGVFGRANFVATVVWQKTLGRENRTDLSTNHEYLLVYAKDRSVWRGRRNLLPLGDEQLARYDNPDGDPRGPWTSGDMTAKAGPGRRAAQFYEIELPSGRVVEPAKGMAWRYTRERFEELVADGRIYFGPAGNNVPRIKRFLAETQGGLVPTTWWPGEEVGTTDSAKKQLRRLFPDLVPFETPKPEELAARVIEIATDRGDLVLDCHAGSGTTPAVAHKLGRRWLAAERERRTFEEFLAPRIDAVIAGEDDGGVTAAAGWEGGGAYELEISTGAVAALGGDDGEPDPELAAAA